MWVSSETGGNMSAHFAISRTAVSRVQTSWGLFDGATPRGIIAPCILLLETSQWQETGVR